MYFYSLKAPLLQRDVFLLQRDVHSPYLPINWDRKTEFQSENKSSRTLRLAWSMTSVLKDAR